MNKSACFKRRELTGDEIWNGRVKGWLARRFPAATSHELAVSESLPTPSETKSRMTDPDSIHRCSVGSYNRTTSSRGSPSNTVSALVVIFLRIRKRGPPQTRGKHTSARWGKRQSWTRRNGRSSSHSSTKSSIMCIEISAFLVSSLRSPTQAPRSAFLSVRYSLKTAEAGDYGTPEARVINEARFPPEAWSSRGMVCGTEGSKVGW